MIGQGKRTTPVQYRKYFFFRADSLNKKMREREGHIEHKFLHKIHLPLPSFQWNCIDFCPFPVEESELCVIFIIAAAVSCGHEIYVLTCNSKGQDAAKGASRHHPKLLRVWGHT